MVSPRRMIVNTLMRLAINLKPANFGKLPDFRNNKPNTNGKRSQQKREFDISTIALPCSMTETDNFSEAELQEDKIVGGIYVKGNNPVSVEYQDNNKNWQFLTESRPGDLGLSSLITLPPVKTKKLRIMPTVWYIT